MGPVLGKKNTKFYRIRAKWCTCITMNTKVDVKFDGLGISKIDKNYVDICNSHKMSHGMSGETFISKPANGNMFPCEVRIFTFFRYTCAQVMLFVNIR